MANNILSSDHPNRAMFALVLFGVVLLMQRVGATEYKVGDANGWTVPNNPNALSYNQWAENHRFQVGDSLLFVYPPEKDSVFQVNMDGYTNCNTAFPIATFTDGSTLFKLSQSGAHYFISGIKDNCMKNEKMHVIVMADRSNQSSNTNQTTLASPPPPPSDSMATPPSPPPSGSIEIVPAPAPAGDESPSPPAPPPNGASSTFVSVLGSFGAFVGSSLLLTL
ncbi:hypothetical protein AQUCO_04700074v1 [Aquilegia coerulea]|uniref:Phytocyanin domain-containing protein n=1 Tax=Aquilegia coerulea TaxID=218851 RepID=A0A2G5CKZ0_AQUCA|nr:hypothetical protein AQUCO_04700074v1 [Aquilegia coerulea]